MRSPGSAELRRGAPRVLSAPRRGPGLRPRAAGAAHKLLVGEQGQIARPKSLRRQPRPRERSDGQVPRVGVGPREPWDRETAENILRASSAFAMAAGAKLAIAALPRAEEDRLRLAGVSHRSTVAPWQARAASLARRLWSPGPTKGVGSALLRPRRSHARNRQG